MMVGFRAVLTFGGRQKIIAGKERGKKRGYGKDGT